MEKGFWNFERTMKDTIEKIKYVITNYTKDDYELHLSS